jgi:DNA-binding transcriptional LysR family regulator
MNDQFDWGDIRVFLAIVDSGSFGKAAEQLGITQPTISRRMVQLETQIGKTLFRRTASGVTLTDAGSELVNLAQKMAASADAIGKMSSTRQALGKVKIRVPDVLASYVVIPKLAEFLSLHPQLTVILDCGIVATDDSSPDISLQFLEPKDSSQLRVPVCFIHYSTFASPEYIETHGAPKTPAELATRRLVHHTSYYAHRENWYPKADAIDVIIEDELILICDSGPLNVQAIKAGVGIGALPTIVAERESGLIPLPLGCFGSLQLNMYHANGAEEAVEIAVCKQWLLELFSARSVRWFDEEFVDPAEWVASKEPDNGG